MSARTQKRTLVLRGVPPYISYKTFASFLDQLQRGIPNRIDRSVMPSLSGSNQSHLIATLGYLGLISSSGVPSETLGLIVRSTGPDRSKLLRKALVDSYPFLFEKFDLRRATFQELEERLSGAGASGDTVRKCVKFFLRAAAEASIETSPFLARMRRDRRLSKGGGKRDRSSVGDEGSLGQDEGVHNNFSLTKIRGELVARFPRFDPSWTDELKGKWFDAYQELLKRNRH